MPISLESVFASRRSAYDKTFSEFEEVAQRNGYDFASPDDGNTEFSYEEWEDVDDPATKSGYLTKWNPLEGRGNEGIPDLHELTASAVCQVLELGSVADAGCKLALTKLKTAYNEGFEEALSDHRRRHRDD